MASVLYRLRGGEVLKISLTDQPFDDRDTAFWGVLTDPPRPDGDAVRDGAGPLRVLGLAKTWDGIDVRNATQAEIDQMPVDEEADEDEQNTARGVLLSEIDPIFKRPLKALALIMKDEINILRIREGLAPRTDAQALTAFRNKINEL